jgi:hypothetical protein
MKLFASDALKGVNGFGTSTPSAGLWPNTDIGRFQSA